MPERTLNIRVRKMTVCFDFLNLHLILEFSISSLFKKNKTSEIVFSFFFLGLLLMLICRAVYFGFLLT